LKFIILLTCWSFTFFLTYGNAHGSTQLELKNSERIAQTALSYINSFLKSNCEGVGLPVDWQEKARFHLRLNHHSESSMKSLINTLSSYISSESICRHIVKISVFSQVTVQSVEQNIEIFSRKALDGQEYLSQEQIKSRMRRTLRGFMEKEKDILAKKINNLRELDKKFGSTVLRENLSRGLGSISALDQEQIKELKDYLISNGYLNEKQFEIRLQQGLSAFSRNRLVELVKPVMETLLKMGISKSTLGQMYLENPDPFVTSKEQDIRSFYMTYLKLLQKSDIYLKSERREEGRISQVVDFIQEKMYLLPGLNENNLKGFISVAQLNVLNLNDQEILNLFHSVLNDLSHNKINWELLRNNIKLLVDLKDETGKSFFTLKQILLFLKGHINSLARQEITNLLISIKLNPREKYGKFLSLMADSVVEDSDQLPTLKTKLHENLKFTRSEFKQLLVKHYRIFMNYDENAISEKLFPIARILGQHMSLERLKSVILLSFSKLMSILEEEEFHLTIEIISGLFNKDNQGEKHKQQVGEVLEVLINGGELINLDLDLTEVRIRQAEEVLSWGYSTKEAVIHTFQAQNLKGPLNKMSIKDLQERRNLFSVIKMRSVATFLRRNETAILSADFERLKAAVNFAENMGINGVDLERWIQLGYLDTNGLEFSTLAKLDKIFENLVHDKIISLPQVNLIIQLGIRQKHEWTFPHGIQSKIDSALRKIDPIDLNWLMPHLVGIFSVRGMELLKLLDESDAVQELDSHNFAKYLYLGIMDPNAPLNNGFILRALTIAPPTHLNCNSLLSAELSP
jgi:hypothetical protein